MAKMRVITALLLATATLLQAQHTCDNGTKTISNSAVNDDYCDCIDASDEFLTSACPMGRFQCKGKDASWITLPSSRVGDGVCDCCDGSDEKIGCENTCLVMAKQRLAERVREWETTKVGYKTKLEIIKYYKQLKLGQEKEKSALEGQIVEWERTVEKLQGKTYTMD
jgi:protein kinase C substrate 80K-H